MARLKKDSTPLKKYKKERIPKIIPQSKIGHPSNQKDLTYITNKKIKARKVIQVMNIIRITISSNHHKDNTYKIKRENIKVCKESKIYYIRRLDNLALFYRTNYNLK